MILKLKIIIIIISVGLFSFGQESDKHMFFISTDFASNTNTFGISENSIKQPNFLTTIDFISKKNFDIGFSNITTLNSDITFSKPTYENDLFCGYTFIINDKWSIYPTYTHMFHSKDAQTLLATFTDVFQGDLSYFGDYYNGSISLEYYLSSKNMFFSSFQNALGFSKEDFIIKKSILDIQLGFYLNFSDINYYNESIYDDFEREEFIYWMTENNYVRELSLIILIERYGLEQVKANSISLVNNSTPGLFESDFKLSSLDLYLPIYYTLGSFMFNFMATINVPLAQSQFYELDNTFMFNAGISYAFYLK